MPYPQFQTSLTFSMPDLSARTIAHSDFNTIEDEFIWRAFFEDAFLTVDQFLTVYEWFLCGNDSIVVLTDNTRKAQDLGEAMRCLIFPFELNTTFQPSLDQRGKDQLELPTGGSFLGIHCSEED